MIPKREDLLYFPRDIKFSFIFIRNEEKTYGVASVEAVFLLLFLCMNVCFYYFYFWFLLVRTSLKVTIKRRLVSGIIFTSIYKKNSNCWNNSYYKLNTH